MSEVKPTRNPVVKGQSVGAAVDPTPAQQSATPPQPQVVRLDIDRKKTVRVKPSHLGLTPEGHKAANIEYWLPNDHDYKSLFNPEYWEPMAGQMQNFARGNKHDFSGSIIHVRRKDHSLYAQLYITEINRTGVFVEQIVLKKIGPQPEDITSKRFDVIWNDTENGYDIVRKSDAAKMVDAKDMRRLAAVYDWLKKTEG